MSSELKKIEAVAVSPGHYIGIYVGEGITLRDTENDKSWASLEGNIIGYCDAISVDNNEPLIYFSFSAGYNGDVSFMVPRDHIRIIRTSNGSGNYIDIYDQ